MALLCTSCAAVPRRLRALASDEVPVVQTSLAIEEDVDNVVDNENTNVHSEANSVSNSVNVVENAHNVITPVATPVITPVVSVEATKSPVTHHQQFRLVNQPKTVTTNHVTNPVHTVSTVQTAPIQSSPVKSQGVSNAKTTYSTVKTVPVQQYYYSVVPQTQTQYSSVKGI